MNIDIAIAVTFVVGLLLYGISSSILRGARETVPAGQPNARVRWPMVVDASFVNADRQLRLDLVERLAIIGEPWCIDVLRQAIEQEDDVAVRSAISVALGSVRTS